MYANTQIHIFLSFEDSERRKILFIFNYLSLLFFYYFPIIFLQKEISEFLKMARTKQCARAASTTTSPSPSPSPNPSPTLPPPPPLLRVTSPAFKSVPSVPSALPSALPPIVNPLQIIVGPPRKKIMYPGPFIKGQVGSVYFSLDKIRSYMEIPHGYLIIIQNFHMRYKFEPCFSKYIIINPLGNKWEAPEVFKKWRQCMETNTIQDLDLNKTSLAMFGMVIPSSFVLL